jgi:hypothetical protein
VGSRLKPGQRAVWQHVSGADRAWAGSSRAIPNGGAWKTSELPTCRLGYLARIWAWRRREAEPTTAPSGSSDRLLYLVEMKTSRTSSRGRLQGRMVPAGR